MPAQQYNTPRLQKDAQMTGSKMEKEWMNERKTQEIQERKKRSKVPNVVGRDKFHFARK